MSKVSLDRLNIRYGVGFMQDMNVGGMVFGRHMMFAWEPGPDIPDWLYRHELEHFYQAQRCGGFLAYTFRYFWQSIRVGYWNNSFEVEAREVQEQPLTMAEQSAIRGFENEWQEKQVKKKECIEGRRGKAFNRYGID